ncbi:NAD(P)-dependent oxidoreductase [Agrobacterium rhizogenes]|uniref:dihydrouracil dehydrogenase (NAD(+)) n=1 Tax=Rhizobium rhizogenes (strain K84 / ATCC BAA-868) TaxID=311403 RepID=B9J872_RHIR8|nr:NAD(P)-dependent oxidoreductase [Rhizobium rhizogenes]ACM27393.1 NADPH-dependent glutamate synthase small chain protein [Rhizobium rhizogenes K84]KAA6484734.1 NAD(P)-dependent oxidoreductase [Agrobacterium sp. ICMP 7243]MDJ1637179.1 NAD(P)-dependent oxidoreductase [Rhizobium rhizogenes]NTF49366.1 NAD(P)-dependent oxidoreductase [Rhizobium rhizogenes]NTF62368.1 NAD(P)-dependent oxidoreductase [Rhizobium rhizogenes]
MGRLETGIHKGRLTPAEYEANFSDLHPRLNDHEALVAADRCYFCYDAPCMTACPTSIDIPLFIRQISTGNPIGSAKTIFDQNILGGMCARVCPTEQLCEQDCVRNTAEERPVEIGRLQRYATDIAMAENKQFYARAASSGKKIAVVGAGPAGLACAHRLAVKGHEVVIFDAREKAGGLNEYGIATYKAVDDFAQKEVDYVLSIGGIEVKNGQALGRDFSLADLASQYDAVFLGLGLAGVNALRAEGEDLDGVADAVAYIAGLRQANDKADIAIGRRVVVLGGGMTAIDAAVQAKLLGAEEVTICYRRGKEHMNASEYEQDLAASKGVMIRHWLAPKRILDKNGKVAGIEVEYTELRDGKLTGTGDLGVIAADQIFKAIGQTFEASGLGALRIEAGRIAIDGEGRTSLDHVWAGGDCVLGGDDLTVSAVAQGRDAAESINHALAASAQPNAAVA